MFSSFNVGIASEFIQNRCSLAGMSAVKIIFHSIEAQVWLLILLPPMVNAEKVTHIKGRILDQAVVLFNCVPFQSGNFS